MTATDYRTAFEQAPIGLVISRDRLMVACNQQVLAMFGAEHDSQFAGRSFELLYPTHEEFERTWPIFRSLMAVPRGVPAS